ncbi:glycosyltransferase [Pseudomonadota bacterium]
MKILHINTSLAGGAAIAVKRIHQGLINSGIDSSILYKSGHSADPTCFAWEAIRQNNFANKLKRNFFSLYRKWQMHQDVSYFLDDKPAGFEPFSPIQLDQKLQFSDLPIRPDIIHLHWIAGFFDYGVFFESIPDKVAIVWTLHDMNAFTGGCHYSWGCERYIKSCGNCPQLANAADNDFSRRIMLEKLRLLSSKSIHVVADSRWIESQAKKSSLFCKAASVRTIHYGLDVDKLAPRDKLACRKALQIPPNCKVIVFGADDIDNKRKGLTELIVAIDILKRKDQDIFLLTFGNKTPVPINDHKLTKHLGFVSSLDMLSIVYSAADVFVMPSLYEAFGQVALEAMSCAVPVVSFDNGGASDIVIDGVTGYLAKMGDPVDLAVKLEEILSDDGKKQMMGMYARDMVVKQFTLNQQAMKYKKMYEELRSRHRSYAQNADIE